MFYLLHTAERVIAHDLIKAVAGGSGANTKSMKLLHQAFKNALIDRAREEEGNARVAAALAGKATFRPLPDGRLVCRFPRTTGSRTKFDEDIVQVTQLF